MNATCHYCREPLTRHESVTEVMDHPGDVRIYHDACHRRDIVDHRERGDRLPEDRPGPPWSLR